MKFKTVINGRSSLSKYLVVLFFLPLICCSANSQNDEKPVPQNWHKPVVFKNMLGINAFEWDFLESPDRKNPKNKIYEPRMDLIKSFSGVRHYLDWERIEPVEGEYTFNPSHNGGSYFDVMYSRCKAENIDVLACIKQCPPWLENTYPKEMRNKENVPAPYGLDREEPASYIAQAKMAFQFAARYGYSKLIDSSLIKVDAKPRWNGDDANKRKSGLGLIKFIECDNERDKWWRGKQAEQSPEEYAANMSAFYDGHKGMLGKGVGVKTADSNMIVVMGGLAKANVEYVRRMVAWCKENRGLRKDGSVNLCFDVINYHLYSNDGESEQHKGKYTQGMSPENSESAKVADEFIRFAHNEVQGKEVWITECGYDVNPKSPLRALAIGKKTQEQTQADWALRTSLLYARHGIQRVFFYMLGDVNTKDGTQFSSSGFVHDEKRRPSADYFLQVKNLLGDFTYKKTISQNPLVDVYQKGPKTIYALTSPTQSGKTVRYNLPIKSGSGSGTLFIPQSGATVMKKQLLKSAAEKLNISVGETPVFVVIN